MRADLQMREICLAVIAEGERIDREPGLGREQIECVTSEGRILGQVIHARVANLAGGMLRWRAEGHPVAGGKS